MSSIQRKLENAGKNRFKKLADLEIHYQGVDLKTIRLKVDVDKFGDEEWVILNSEILNVVIDNWGEIPLNRTRGDSGTSTSKEGLYLWEVLPIEMFSKFEDNVEFGDILIFIVENYDKKIPILFKVSEELGTLNTLLRYRKHYIAMYNGTLPSEVKTIIDSYISEF